MKNLNLNYCIIVNQINATNLFSSYVRTVDVFTLCMQFFLTALEQGFLNFWFHGAREEVNYYLRSPTINLKKQKRIVWGALRFLKRSAGDPYGAL